MESPELHLKGGNEATAPEMGVEEQVAELIECGADAAELAPVLELHEGPDAADVLERLEPSDSADVLEVMRDADAADALAHMVPELAVTVLADLTDADAATLLGMMGPDDAADILQLIDESQRHQLVALMHPKRAAQVRRLALDDPETAAGIMTTEIGVIRRGLTIGEAIGFVKRNPASESQQELYVVDEDKRLVGEVTMRDLLIRDDSEPVEDYLLEVKHPLTAEMDREEVAAIFGRYDLVTAPVLDDQHRVLGMVTVDDVLDILTAESAEDALKQVGAGRDEGVHSTLGKKLRSRVPWLTVNLITSQLAAAVILAFADLIEMIPVTAAVYPIIANEAGNGGSQSFALTLQGLVSGEVRSDKLGKLVRREAAFGLIAGLFVGLVFAAGMFGVGLLASQMGWEGVLSGLDWKLAIVAGAAMSGALWAGCVIGVTMPIVMKKLGFDPATASSIFLMMLTDAMSFAAFLGLVFALKEWLLV